MSNLVTSAKNKRKRELRKVEDEELLKRVKTMPTTKDGKVQIDFQSRVLPKSVYIHMATGQIKFGDETNPIRDCPVIHTMTNDIDSAEKAIELLESLGEVTKVVMDNSEDFKIFALEEFIRLLRTQIDKLIDAKIAAASKPNSDISGELD